MSVLRHPTNPNNRLDDCVFHVSVDTTSHCNLHCTHCWMQSIREQGFDFRNHVMELELFRHICSQFAGRCNTFGLSCGFEPLLNPRLPEFVECAASFHIPDIHFYTNGLLMTPVLASRLVEAGLSRIVFSLEGVDVPSFARYRPNASWDRFVSAVEGVSAARCAASSPTPASRFNWVVTAENLELLEKLPELALRLDVGEIYLIPELRWQQTFRGEPHVFDIFPERSIEIIDRFRSNCEHRGIAADVSMLQAQHSSLFSGASESSSSAASHPACLQPWSVMVITSQGIVSPCWASMITRSYGNFNTQSLEEIWASREYDELRRGLQGDGPPCDHCQSCVHWRPGGRGRSFDTPRWLDANYAATLLPLVARHAVKP